MRDLSFACSAEVYREAWRNGRLVLPNMPDAFKEPLARDVRFVQGELAVIFWFRGRLSFRVGLVGGFQDERPIYREGVDGALAHGGLTLGMTSRY